MSSRYILGLIFLFVISCNESSTFTEGEKSDQFSSDDARGVSGNPVSEVKNSEEETVLEARNPFEASDSQIFSFAASQELEDSFLITLDDKKLMTAFDLSNLYSDKEDLHNQITRTPLSKMAQQGSIGQAYNETFDQEVTQGLLDILIVIDNSGSMGQEQNNLSTKLSALLSSISSTNWRIAFTTTDPKDDCVHRVISKGDQNANSLFADAVNVGTSGTGKEQGIRRAVEGLSCTSTPWVRNESSLAVLIVSDEDNCSDGKGCGSDPWSTETYLIDYVEKTMNRTVGQNAGFYGIFSDPADSCNTAYNDAAQYKKLVEYKAGNQKNYGDICDADYSATLNLISKNILTILRSQWELTATPDAGTLNIEFEANGVKTPISEGAYTLMDKTLTFMQGSEPPEGSKVLASYVSGMRPKFTSLDLGETPAAGTLSVRINGTLLNESQYTLMGTLLTFNNEPADDATVKADFRRNTAFLTEFAVQGTPKDNKVDVFLNDTQTNDFSYDTLTKKITLTATPADGDKIKLVYKNNDGPKLSYDLMIGGNNPRDYALFFGETPVNFTRVNNTFTINSADHAENRRLVLKYEADDTEEKMFNIPYSPLANSFKIESTSNCNLGEGFEIDGTTLKSTCIVDSQTEFAFSYRYLSLRREFSAPSVMTPEQGTWKVYVNGESFTDFTRDGTTITLNGEIPVSAKIEIHYEFGN